MAARRNPVVKALVQTVRARRLVGTGRVELDWHDPVGGRAPRLGPRDYIGHEIEGAGPWKGHDPLRTPKWWTLTQFGSVLLWAGVTAGAGYLSWRRHGGMDGLLGRDGDVAEDDDPQAPTEDEVPDVPPLWPDR